MWKNRNPKGYCSGCGKPLSEKITPISWDNYTGKPIMYTHTLSCKKYDKDQSNHDYFALNSKTIEHIPFQIYIEIKNNNSFWITEVEVGEGGWQKVGGNKIYG